MSLKSLVPIFVILASSLAWHNVGALEGSARGVDDRINVNVNTYPWSSIGKLYNSVGGACTGVVIERDKVLTAAHCLFNARTGRLLPATSLHLLLGYERGTYRVHARVTRYEIGPGYDPKLRAETLPNDWSVLTLAAPLPSEVQSLALAPATPEKGTRLRTGGFGRDRRYVMTADTQCQALGLIHSNMLLAHSCRASHGNSGAPLLADSDEEATRILGLNVASAHRNGVEVGVAIPASAIMRELATRQAKAMFR